MLLGRLSAIVVRVFGLVLVVASLVHKAVLPVERVMVRVGLGRLYFGIPLATTILVAIPLVLGIQATDPVNGRVDAVYVRITISVFAFGAFFWLWNLSASKYWRPDGSFDKKSEWWTLYTAVCVVCLIYIPLRFLL